MRLNRRIILLYGSILACCLFLIFLLSTVGQTGDGQALKQEGRRAEDGREEEQREALEKEACYYDSQCPEPQILFRLHAETSDHPPYGCLNDIHLFHNNLSVGINVLSLNGTTGDVLEAHTFDVTTSDGKLISWLRSLPEFAIVIAVSFGDIAERVSRDARETFHVFGAAKIDDWKAGSSYSIIGQRGLKGQHAFEQIMSLTALGDSQHIFEGCLDLPIGDIGQVNITETVSDEKIINRLDEDRLAQLGQAEARKHFLVELGAEQPNCGLKEPCKKDEIAMSFFSGEHKDDFPKVCVGGSMVFDKGLNKAGRGLNIFSLEPKTAKVRLVANFDTYEDDTPALEDFLDTIPNGDIVAAVSFDEASTALSDMAKQIFYELGSSQIYRLKFRASWYFVGQKGIKAYTPFEDLIYPTGNSWAKPIQTAICVPKSLSKWSGRTAEEHPTVKNIPKRHFCAKYDKYDEFCSDSSIDKPIAPRPLSNVRRSKDRIYNTPIVIMAGLSTTGLQKCLESLMNQEGLNTQMVLVVHDREYGENSELATLFHAKSLAVNISTNPNGLLNEAITNAFHLFPSAPAIAVIEEDVIPTPDWLKFFELTLPVLLEDTSLDLVQAFNDFGYRSTSSRSTFVYRVDYQPPKASFLLSRRFYDKNVANQTGCCNPSKWNLTSSAALIPELSRVQLQEEQQQLHAALMDETKRSYSTGNGLLVLNGFRSEEKYDAELKLIYAHSEKIRVPKAGGDCTLFTGAQNASSVSYLLTSSSDLRPALKCLNIPRRSPPPTYKGIFRFFHDQLEHLLIVKESTLLTA